MTECVPDRSCRGSASLELGLSSPIVQVVPTAFPSDSKEQLENLAVPLPPIAEQRRIVADVNDVMALFDRIAAGLAAADGTRSCLFHFLPLDPLESAQPNRTASGRIGA